MSKRWTGIWMALISGAAAVLLVHGVVHAASGRSEQPPAPAAEVIRFQLSADKLYSAVMQGSRNESYYELRTLKKLCGESLLRQHGHTEGWAEVDRTILGAEQALQAGAADGTLLDAASRLRLAADSLTMGDRALWLQYEPLLLEDARQMVIAWTPGGEQSRKAANARLITLSRHWELVEPAARLNRDPDQAASFSEGIRLQLQAVECQK